ncbi:hypothetical protein CROQUDRAFT_39299 [Cronartium quercuum f. sp. fusiforme G11]|uniref:Uncharacterized protein n=1 Tax=Cronartium quercuum f. sp. fusiforme G11 TaxID=708437 RepID=A0A9P6NQG9_9BASI|nr:hypothetical protein CROQUDRAFT_39299 [Cronartium quercuum f. sp. fusiforme G11]
MATEPDTRFYIDVDALQDLGISAQDIKKLKDGGFATVKAVINASRKQLTALKGISEIKVDKIKDSAAKLSGPMFKTGKFLIICYSLLL